MKNILLIDNDDCLIQYYKSKIETNEKYKIFYATNLVDAYRIISHLPIHMVFCDYFLNEETGIEFITGINRINKIPTYIFSASQKNLHIYHAIEEKQIKGFIGKPLQIGEIEAIVNSNLKP